MTPLYSIKEYNKAKSKDQLPLKCEYCNSKFFQPKKLITFALKLSKSQKTDGKVLKFCSHECDYKSRKTIQTVQCINCNKSFEKLPSRIKKTPNHFCSRSCAAIYNNAHKKHGTRRSKLEKWLESQLNTIYPDLEIHYNRKDAINSELDIYIPSLSLAFELNGIFHYEPIYGQEKLASIQNNDERKFQACIAQSIEMCIIDTSKFTYFKPKKAQKFLDIITNLIDSKL